jgi:hypothetical protein
MGDGGRRVLLDLRAVDPERARLRVCTALERLPDGARVDVVVGPLAANPDAARVLADHIDRLDISILGEPYSVPNWLDVIRNPDVLSWDPL